MPGMRPDDKVSFDRGYFAFEVRGEGLDEADHGPDAERNLKRVEDGPGGLRWVKQEHEQQSEDSSKKSACKARVYRPHVP